MGHKFGSARPSRRSASFVTNIQIQIAKKIERKPLPKDFQKVSPGFESKITL